MRGFPPESVRFVNIAVVAIGPSASYGDHESTALCGHVDLPEFVMSYIIQ